MTEIYQNLESYPKDLLVNLYEDMILIRRFEERVKHLFGSKSLSGYGHLYIGEEAVAVGVCSQLRKDDYIVSTHRGHGHVIAKGGSVKRMMAELYGKRSGSCKGKGGSMHITDMEIGMLGANGIVGGGLPIALGAAYSSAHLRKTDQVTVAFFGDGATAEGTFHETCNMAAALKLPIVFICENNYYGVGTRVGRIAPYEEMYKRAAGYEMPSTSVEGNDVLAVSEAAGQAVEQARKGEGPTFIECRTWRHLGHFVDEVPSYWDQAEYDSWIEKDPVKTFGRALIMKNILNGSELEELDDRALSSIDEAVSFAKNSELPRPEEALEDVYA